MSDAKEYKVIRVDAIDGDLVEFHKAVNAHLQDGWQLVGVANLVSIPMHNNAVPFWIQTMVFDHKQDEATVEVLSQKKR